MGKLVPIMAALEIFKFYLISEQMLLFKCETNGIGMIISLDQWMCGWQPYNQVRSLKILHDHEGNNTDILNAMNLSFPSQSSKQLFFLSDNILYG